MPVYVLFIYFFEVITLNTSNHIIRLILGHKVHAHESNLIIYYKKKKNESIESIELVDLIAVHCS